MRTQLFRSACAALCGIAVMSGCSRPSANTFQGYAEGEFVHIATSESGCLQSLQATKGMAVESGAPLFALEAKLETAQYRQAEQQRVTAEAQLLDIQSGKRPQEVDVVRAQLDQATAEATKSASDLTRDEAQFEAGGIARAQRDHSRAAAASSAARVRELSGQLEVAKLPARKDQIEAQIAQVAAARAAVEQAEWRVNQKTIASPVAGRVFDTLYREGEWVPAGRPVVRLLPPGNIKVRFFVPETELGRLTLGQALVLRCDGVAADIPAMVSYISTEAEYTPPIIYSNETRAKLVFMVEAKPAAGTQALHPGQPVQVTIK